MLGLAGMIDEDVGAGAAERRAALRADDVFMPILPLFEAGRSDSLDDGRTDTSDRHGI